ncbi:hypothetical protein ECEC1737_0806 [Escherichia coli EC1737]|nr:hypothetical protein ECEC1737_0806 [Escherichia coli EC1737]EKJ18152.1 hypothetical protein ECEC1864_1005 [Escherichia coli EC1864]
MRKPTASESAFLFVVANNGAHCLMRRCASCQGYGDSSDTPL